MHSNQETETPPTNMLTRILEFWDFDTTTVALAGVMPWAIMELNLEMIVKLVSGIGAAVYIWLKIVRLWRDKK